MENYIETLNKAATFFQKHFSPGINFTLFVLEKEEFKWTLDKKDYIETGGVIAKRFIFSRMLEKDISEILSQSSIKEEDANHFVVGKIYILSPIIYGEINFVEKLIGNVLNKQFLMTNYIINFKDKKYKFSEITSDQEDGLGLVALTLKDIQRDCFKFVKERKLA